MKHLRELGYGSHFLIEVPLRGVPKRKGMEKALNHLSSAWEHFNDGSDDEALASCYKAFEYLSLQCGVKNPDQNAFEKLLAGVGDRKKIDSLKLLMRYVCDYLNLGRHEGGQPETSLDRRDAEYALILSQATLSYLANRMIVGIQKDAGKSDAK